MKNKYIKLALKLFSIIGLLSVGIFAQSNLDSMHWNLTEINRQKVTNSKAFFETDQNRLTGNAGCNQMFAKVSIKGNKIKFGEISTTKMFCGEEGVMKLESDLTSTLEKVTRFEKSGSILKLYAGNRLTLKFKGAPKNGSGDENSIKLEDKKWVLESIKNNSLPKVATEAFINFNKTKGSAGGNTSCNAFGGNYTANGENIGFTDIFSTMRACIEDERMNVERGFLDGLQKANRYEIIKGKLNLYQDKKLLLTFKSKEK